MVFGDPREKRRREAAAWLARMQGPESDGNLAAFRRWHDADPANAEAYARVRGHYRDAGLLAGTAVGRRRDLRDVRRTPARRRLALAAPLLLLLASGAALLGRRDRLGSPAQAEMLAFSTEVGEIREVALHDGTRLTLDTGTRVRVALGKKVRRFILDIGRARIVAPADARPFLADAGALRVRGTQGSFDLALAQERATVQPLAGTISVELAGGPSQALRLAPGEIVLVRTGRGRVERSPAASSIALWPTGMLDFDQTPLDQVVTEANRYARRPLRLGDPALSSRRVTGTFRAGDTDGLARSLAAAFGLSVESSATGETILRDPQKKKGGD